METTKIGTEVSATEVEQMQRMMEEFATSTNDAQRLLIDLHAKLAAPAE